MEKGTVSNRKLKAIETKNKIYHRAEQLFRKHGIENVSVDSIVETAGVSKGTFYVHFDSKNSLIAAMINDYVKKLDLGYKSYRESFAVNTSATDILISLTEKIADTIANNIGYNLMKIAYEVQLTKASNTNILLDYNRELYKVYSEIISKGVEQGEFKAETPVAIITNHFIMAFRGLTYEWCIRYPNLNLKEQILTHFKMLLTGIKKQ